MRLNGQALGCKVSRPSVSGPARSPVVCVSPSEAADARFAGEVAAAAHAEGMLVTTLSVDGVALRQGAPGRTEFVRQFVSSTAGARESVAALVARSAAVLFGAGTAPPAPAIAPGPAWYRRWWVWGLVGATVAGVAIAAVATSGQNDRVTVVFRK
jgi:hypothetical protein